MHDDLLAKAGIQLRNTGIGNRKAPCPQCSHQRTKKTDPCLSVTISGTDIRWLCHHCGWSGIRSPDSVHTSGKQRSSERKFPLEWKRKMKDRWW